jgi:predicted negative regulator of RcsB-dependent stress response
VIGWLAAKEIAGRVPARAWLGLAFVVAGLIGLAWTYYSGKAEAREEAAAQIANLESALALARAANESNVETIRVLTEKNHELAEGRAADREAAAVAVAKVAKERDALAADLERRRKDRGNIYERDPPAAAWAAARVPDSVVRSLRD